jgi:hypothetical protein
MTEIKDCLPENARKHLIDLQNIRGAAETEKYRERLVACRRESAARSQVPSGLQDLAEWKLKEDLGDNLTKGYVEDALVTCRLYDIALTPTLCDCLIKAAQGFLDTHYRNAFRASAQAKEHIEIPGALKKLSDLNAKKLMPHIRVTIEAARVEDEKKRLAYENQARTKEATAIHIHNSNITTVGEVRSEGAKEKAGWSRNDKIAAIAVAVAVVAIIVGLLSPEVRGKLGIDKPAPVTLPQAQVPTPELPVGQNPNPSTVTVTSSNSSSQAVADKRVSNHGMPVNIPTARDSAAKSRKEKNTANARPTAQPSETSSVSTAGSQGSHIHFNRGWMPNGIDMSDCNYCSVTGSQIGANNARHAGVVIGNNDSVKVANNYIDGGISAHGNTQDAEIRRNEVGRTTAGLENAGKAERILFAGNIVQPSAGNPAQIIKNDPGGELKDVTALNNEVKAAPVPPPISQVCAPGASCAISNGQQGGITAGAVNVGNQARQITTENTEALTSGLKNFNQKITLAVEIGTWDGMQFASQLRSALRAAGVSVDETIPWKGILPIGGPPMYGVQIGFHGEEKPLGTPIYYAADSQLGILRLALEAAHIKVTHVNSDPNLPDDTMLVCIGFNLEDPH